MHYKEYVVQSVSSNGFEKRPLLAVIISQELTSQQELQAVSVSKSCYSTYKQFMRL